MGNTANARNSSSTWAHTASLVLQNSDAWGKLKLNEKWVICQETVATFFSWRKNSKCQPPHAAQFLLYSQKNVSINQLWVHCLMEEWYGWIAKSQFIGCTLSTARFSQTTHIWLNRHLKWVKISLYGSKFQWCPIITTFELPRFFSFLKLICCSVFPSHSSDTVSPSEHFWETAASVTRKVILYV